MWITEDAFAPSIIFVMIGLGLAFAAHSNQKPRLYVAAGFMAILCGLTYYIEHIVVTDREKVEDAIYKLADSFQRNDRAGMLSNFPPVDIDLQNLANTAMDMVDIEDDYRITDMDVDVSADSTLAKSTFRVNATASVYGVSSEARTRWELNWRKDGGKWRIVEVKRLEPLSGREMGPLQLGK